MRKILNEPTELEPFDWRSLSQAPVIGLDEVGRGCLAGPVYAAAVIVPESVIEKLVNAGVTDSKLVSEKKRSGLAELICETCFFGLGSASSQEIDEINILQATFLSMKRALVDLEARFGHSEGHLLIDGNQKIPFRGLPFERPEFQKWAALLQTTLIKGDSRALPIAAASIVAKVTRDRLMIAADEEYPVYGFKGHKGYAAEVHRKAIKEHGPTPIHRKTFGGVREFVRL
ncbi:MAG: ribonuclease HII [Deltaproteobacteria bacterium]|nr:ribonuclease HII [Deltaproteobacteria bacterium]